MKPNTPQWLKQAVFYQIYPQSFYDANGDGIGDLQGVLEKLDYLQWLGVNAIWLNPCFDSPFQDAGYDVRDYYQVAARYGSNADLKTLFAEAKKRGMHIILDLVIGHTSVEHAWFQQSARHEPNPYTDWFVWNDNIWCGAEADLPLVRGFGERNGGYVTNFFWFQPALNFGFANPDPDKPWQQPVDAPAPQALRQEMKNIMRFWLDMGADGFRCDMASSLVKRDAGHRETAKIWADVRAWMDKAYPDAALIAEWGRPEESIPAGFHIDFMLGFECPGLISLWRKREASGNWTDAYAFSFFDELGHGNIRQFTDEFMRYYNKTREAGYIALFTGNHDQHPRISCGRDARMMKLIFFFLLTMPGTPFIYYGDEIGMKTLDGLPSKEGGYLRTGIRTPMQWQDAPNAGFSTATKEALYLPVDESADRPTVAQQQADPDSLLLRVKALIALRQQYPALQSEGGFSIVKAEAGVLPFVYLRTHQGQQLLVAINPSAQPVGFDIPQALITKQPQVLDGSPQCLLATQAGWRLELSGVSGAIISL